MNKCIDCGEQVSTKKTKRCNSCFMKGKNNPSFGKKGKEAFGYIDGRSKKKYRCFDCNKEISRFSAIYGSGLCSSCFHKEYLKNPKDHPNYKHGKCYKDKHYYCIDCNKEVCSWKIKRCQSCACKNRFKDPRNHPNYGKRGREASNYIHGKAYEPYASEFNKKLKNQIKQRDNYICQHCGMTQEEHFKKYNRDIEVHHIDYDGKNYKKDNLITLCKSDNMKANKNRDYWFAYYTYIMENYIYV